MTRSISIQEQIQELKRKISAIEWDLPILKNEGTKARRVKELNTTKNRLAELLNDNPSKDNRIT